MLQVFGFNLLKVGSKAGDTMYLGYLWMSKSPCFCRVEKGEIIKKSWILYLMDICYGNELNSQVILSL